MINVFNRYIFIAGVILVIALVFYLQTAEIPTQKSTSVDQELMPVKQALFELQQDEAFVQSSKEKQLEKTIAVLEQIPDSHQRLKKYRGSGLSMPDTEGQVFPCHIFNATRLSQWQGH